MKKSLFYLVLIAVLAVVAYVVVNQNRSSTVDATEKAFAYKATKDISKVILTHKAGEQAVLTLEDGIWMINGRYEARRRAVNTLLETMRRITPMYPVSKAGHDDIVRDLLSNSIKVELFEDGKSKPVKVLHVGGGAINNDGTYMILESNKKMAKRPYVVSITGFSGYLTSRFITNEEEWRSTEIIRYQPDQIKSVEVDYPNQKEKSFTISRGDDGKLALFPPTEKPTNEDRMNAYFSLFESRSIEAFENEYAKIDSVMMNDPYSVISITPTDGPVEIFKIYYKPVTDRTKFKFDALNMPMEYDVDRYFVSFNDGEDFGILQYYVFGALFRERSEFIR